jgi:hypothetical protein
MQLILRLIGHEAPAPVTRFPPGQYILGRSSVCHVRFEDQAVSRRHALLSVDLDRASVCDLDSKYGTAVNGWSTAAEQALSDGDRLSLAGNNFRVRFHADEDSPGPGCLTVPSGSQGPAVEIPVPRGGPCAGASLPDPALRTGGVGAKVYIFCSGPWIGGDGRGFEWALDGLLRGNGHRTFDEDQGFNWGIDMLLYAGADVEAWVGRLVTFLQDWQVPEGTVLSIIAYPGCGGVKHQRIEIPSRTSTCT